MELSWRSTVSSAVDIGYPTPRVWPLGDVALLLLIIIAPVLTGRAIGLFTDSASGIVDIPILLAFVAAYAGFEVSFLTWITHCSPKPVTPRPAIAFALRIQSQVAMQVLTRGAVIVLFVYAFDTLTFAPSTSVAAIQPGSPWPLLSFLAQLAIVLSISISWWRCLSLKRNGANFTALLDGTFVLKKSSSRLAASLSQRRSRSTWRS